MATQTVPLSGLARRLVEDGILDAESAQNASEEARKAGTPFVSFLVSHEIAESRARAGDEPVARLEREVKLLA